jgi:hypothetical protein
VLGTGDGAADPAVVRAAFGRDERCAQARLDQTRELNTMKSMIAWGARSLALALPILAAPPVPAWAATVDYEFQLIEQETKQGNAATIAVRLIDKRSGKPVENAVVFATRMDMAPDAMEAMTTLVEPMPSSEPGVYRFTANLMMEGGWRFSIAAKVQGEEGTVEGRLIFKAVP